MQIIPIRILFQKTGRAKYISHLDTMRTMTRAFKRSKLPLWYTEGFNPHLYCTFALPIALGYESVCETVDVRLTESLDGETVVAKLNPCLPEGFRAVRAAPPVMKADLISWADYTVQLDYCHPLVAGQGDKWTAFLQEPEIPVVKRTKKGEKTVDIKPLTRMLNFTNDGESLTLTLRLASGNKININPTLLLSAYEDWSGDSPDRVGIRRTCIYNDKLEPFE